MDTDAPPLVDVRMIDFAHTTHAGFHDDVVHEGPDRDYMWGLSNLIHLFQQLQNEHCGHFKLPSNLCQ
jgi:inositol-hexakisphosphate kinase